MPFDLTDTEVTRENVYLKTPKKNKTRVAIIAVNGCAVQSRAR